MLPWDNELKADRKVTNDSEFLSQPEECWPGSHLRKQPEPAMEVKGSVMAAVVNTATFFLSKLGGRSS